MRSGGAGAKKSELGRLVGTTEESSADTIDTSDFRFGAQFRSRQAVTTLIEVDYHWARRRKRFDNRLEGLLIRPIVHVGGAIDRSVCRIMTVRSSHIQRAGMEV